MANLFERFSWKPDTIHHPLQPEGGRGIDLYELILGFDRSELAGQQVLDLGTGPTGKISRELQEDGIATRVINLSPDFSIFPIRDFFRRINTHPSIAGLAQELPFKDNVFDRILMLHAFEHAAREERDFLHILSEVSRVLAPRGKAHIGPFRPIYIGSLGRVGNYDYEIMQTSDQVREIFRRNQIQISDSQLPESYGRYSVKDEWRHPIGEYLGYRIILEKFT